MTLCVSLVIAAAACGGGHDNAEQIDLREEARGIPWELLSGKIAYARWDSPLSYGHSRGLVFLIDVAAREVRLIRDVPVTSRPPNYTTTGYAVDLALRRDGTSVTFAIMNPQYSSWELRDLSLSDGAETLLFPDSNAHHLYPSWSRDGHLAYWNNGSSGRGMFVDGVFLLGGCDNSRLAWTASGAVIVSLENENSQGNLCLADPATHAITPLLVNEGPEWDAEIYSQPALSPDGSRIAYVRWGLHVTENVWVADVDGSNRVQLSHDGGYQPAWSADGKSVLFNHWGKDLYLADVATGALTQVTQHPVDYVDWAP
jgi:dipeptidyl aminopeptidase/acylaminoacyl peptidase